MGVVKSDRLIHREEIISTWGMKENMNLLENMIKAIDLYRPENIPPIKHIITEFLEPLEVCV